MLSNSKIITFSLVGCGRIAKRHSDLLGNNIINNAKLISVCDKVENKAQKLSSQFSIPYFTDMDKMIIETNPDVIVVLTESGNHAKNVIDLAKHKKHIIVEKPMALKVDDGKKMIDVCNYNNIKLFVVKQNRFNLPVVKLKEALDNNRFKKITLATVRVRWCRTQDYYDMDTWRGTWKLDGGVLSNQASHHIDLLDWLMGGTKSVIGYSKTSLVNIEVEDTAVVILKFNNGSLGIIEATTATRPRDLEGSLSILGEGGSVVIEGFAVNKIKTWEFINMQKSDEEIMKRYSSNPPNVYGYGHEAFYNNVMDCLINNNETMIDGLEGLKSIKILNAIYDSINMKKEIFLW